MFWVQELKAVLLVSSPNLLINLAISLALYARTISNVNMQWKKYAFLAENIFQHAGKKVFHRRTMMVLVAVSPAVCLTFCRGYLSGSRTSRKGGHECLSQPSLHGERQGISAPTPDTPCSSWSVDTRSFLPALLWQWFPAGRKLKMVGDWAIKTSSVVHGHLFLALVHSFVGVSSF